MASRWEPPPGHTIRHIVSAYLTRIVKSLAGLPGEREEARPASIPEAVSTGVPFSAMRDSDRRVLSSAAMPTPIAFSEAITMAVRPAYKATMVFRAWVGLAVEASMVEASTAAEGDGNDKSDFDY